MITRKVQGLNGKTVTLYLPGTEEDVRALQEKAQARILDDRESFGDSQEEEDTHANTA